MPSANWRVWVFLPNKSTELKRTQYHVCGRCPFVTVCTPAPRRGGLDLQCLAVVSQGSGTTLPAKPLSSLASHSLNKTLLAMATFWRGVSSLAKLMRSGTALLCQWTHGSACVVSRHVTPLFSWSVSLSCSKSLRLATAQAVMARRHSLSRQVDLKGCWSVHGASPLIVSTHCKMKISVPLLKEQDKKEEKKEKKEQDKYTKNLQGFPSFCGLSIFHNCLFAFCHHSH